MGDCIEINDSSILTNSNSGADYNIFLSTQGSGGDTTGTSDGSTGGDGSGSQPSKNFGLFPGDGRCNTADGDVKFCEVIGKNHD